MPHPPSNSDPAPRGAGLPEPALAAQALSQLLRPLARLMIDHGVQLPAMLELIKAALVDEAQAAYALDHKGSSDTRIALLTGVHRKDVRRLREAPHREQAPSTMLPLAASVVARWISDPRFLNTDQSPRLLARTPGRGSAGEPDFTTLVGEISRDVGARSVLDELVRLGVVERRDDGMVALRVSGFVPQDGRGESFYFLTANLADHLSSSVHNLKPGQSEPLMLEQSAFAQGLSADQAGQLHTLARRLWAKTLQQFLQTAAVAEQRSAASADQSHRVRFGVYFYDTQEGPVAPPTEPAALRLPAKRKVKK
ncbi:MAG: DUF6502 family protein [Rhodoferax sp.]